MSELDGELRALLSADIDVAPPRDVAARVLARVEATAGFGGPGEGAGGAQAGTNDGGSGTTIVSGARWIAPRAFALVLAAGGGFAARVAMEPAPRVEIVPVMMPLVIGVPASSADAVSSDPPRSIEPTPLAPSATNARALPPTVVSARPPSASVATASAPGTAPTHDTDLARERALLETARAALARGQAADALASASRHAEEFPRGRLAEERESIAIQALVRSGRLDLARARAARFRAQFPKSFFGPVVDGAVGNIP